MTPNDQVKKEKVKAKELLDCLQVAATWLTEVKAVDVSDPARWSELLAGILAAQKELDPMVTQNNVVDRPMALAGRGVGTSGTTGCDK